MYYIYVLYSNTIDKYYIGSTSNVENRLSFHNSENNRIWSKRGQPWVKVFEQEFEDKTQAIKAEKFIKKQKSRKFIQKLVKEGWKYDQ